MQNLMMSPEKKDYLFVNGSPIATDRILEKAYIALTIPRGQWIYGQTFQGSYLYKLENVKREITV